MITYRIEHEPEEDIQVRGNASAIDPETDKETEDAILARLERGEEWAWCMVRVVASVEIDGETFEGAAHLGACSYQDEADFQAGGYFEQMKEEAADDLRATLAAAVKRGEIAASVVLE